MTARIIRLGLLAGAVAVTLTGCRGCIRENVVYEHVFNKPDCRGCPRTYPEFEMPPGGPYVPAPASQGYAPPASAYPKPAAPRPARDVEIDK
jgi:hypothetical protein